MLEPKRRKVAQYCDECYTDIFTQNFSSQTFDKLPDAIIERIFGFLSLAELAQISLTCHKFQDAARKHFELKRQCGRVKIETRLRHPRVKFEAETILHRVRFRSLMSHVKLTFKNKECVADAFKFIKDNCYNRLKSLEIWLSPRIITNDENLNINEADVFAEQLEYLVLSGGIGVRSICHIFPNLRALSIEIMTPEYQTIFFNQKFPKLRTLIFSDISCHEFNQREFEHFLQHNTQVENFHCENAEIIRGVLSAQLKLSNAILTFQSEYSAIEGFLDDIENCSNRKTIDYIHIVTDFVVETTVQRLSRIENVTSIHFKTFKFSENMDCMPYIRQLCLRWCTLVNQHQLNKIVKKFPNLEDLSLGFWEGPLSCKDFISFIIRGLPSLKYLFCFGVNRHEINENIHEWNTVRSNLENAPHLTIRFESSNRNPNAFVKNKFISINIVGNYTTCICLFEGGTKQLIFLENIGSPLRQRQGNDEFMPKRAERKLINYCDECNTKASNECSSNERLDQLPIEIVEKIFEFLPPNDLARMSSTCHKFQYAARQFFELKRQCGFVIIRASNSSHAHFYFQWQKDIFNIRFRNLIPHVVVYLENAEHFGDVLNFVKHNCYKHLKSFEIRKLGRDQIPLRLNNIDVIAEQLKSVQTLLLEYNVQSDYQWNIFSNLYSLCVDNMMPENQTVFFNQTFPKLRSLCIRDWHCNQDEFDNFLQNNPQLKNILCNNAESIRCVLSTKTKLSHAVLKFELFENNIVDALDDLQECSNRGNIDSMHIFSRFGLTMSKAVKKNILRILGQMKHVKCLHLKEIEHKVLNRIDALPHVQELCITAYCREEPMTQPKLNAIVRCFPNLVKLYVYGDDSISLLSPKDFISSIIGNFLKLKDLYFADHLSRREINENFQEWNIIRSTLPHVPHLNIHFGYTSNIRLIGDSISVSGNNDDSRSEIYGVCLICRFPSQDLSYLERLS